MKQEFQIESYDREDYQVVAHCVKGTRYIPVYIPLNKFEFWLRTSDKLCWELNLSDHSGSHVQTTGNMDVNEYWDGDMPYIYADLYEYIVTHPITFRCTVVENSLQSLLNEFEKPAL